MNPVFKQLIDKKVDEQGLSVDQQMHLHHLRWAIIRLSGLHQRAESSVQFAAEMFDKFTDLNIVRDNLLEQAKGRQDEIDNCKF